MKNAVKVLFALGLVVSLSGCPIFLDFEDVDTEPPDCSWGCFDTDCDQDSDCPSGYFCNEGLCDATWMCDVDGWCPQGYVCDSRETCVPGTVEDDTCTTDEECPFGFCQIPENHTEGVCVTTGTCTTDEECYAYGPGLACDEDSGICVPDEGPCPEGNCGCVNDSECVDGFLCIESRCTDFATICVFDVECGTGTCINNDCHASCAGGEACPVGQDCVEGICTDLEVGIDGCVFDEDCGAGFHCLNASCHPACSLDEECADGMACSSGSCRADADPVRTCSEGGVECADGMACILGVCRMPCVAPINCVGQGEMTECSEGFCHTASELSSVCIRAADCSGADCVDGQCVTPAQ